MRCRCFYFDPDPEAEGEPGGTCYCGHVEDEHDDDGECTVEVDD